MVPKFLSRSLMKLVGIGRGGHVRHSCKYAAVQLQVSMITEFNFWQTFSPSSGNSVQKWLLPSR